MSDFEEQWQRRFERFATRHQADHQVSGWSVAGLRQRLALFEGLLDRGLLTQGGRVLELGCGAGTYVRLLGKRGHSVVGLDYSLPSLSRAAAAASDPVAAHLLAAAVTVLRAAGRAPHGLSYLADVIESVEAT